MIKENRLTLPAQNSNTKPKISLAIDIYVADFSGHTN